MEKMFPQLGRETRYRSIVHGFSAFFQDTRGTMGALFGADSAKVTVSRPAAGASTGLRYGSGRTKLRRSGTGGLKLTGSPPRGLSTRDLISKLRVRAVYVTLV